jgi:hypothetical protein
VVRVGMVGERCRRKTYNVSNVYAVLSLNL